MMKYNQGSKENQKKAIIPKNMFMEGQIHEQNKGITLIALVITIIVLLILAAVTINTLTGENGIITKASQASDETTIGQKIEQIELAILELISNNMETSGSTEWNSSDLLVILESQISDSDIDVSSKRSGEEYLYIVTIDDNQYGITEDNEVVYLEGGIFNQYIYVSEVNEETPIFEFTNTVTQKDIDVITGTSNTEYKILGISLSEDGTFQTDSLNGKTGTLSITNIDEANFAYTLTNFFQDDEVFYVKIAIGEENTDDYQEKIQKLTIVQGDVVKYEECFNGITYDGTWYDLEDERFSGGKAKYTEYTGNLTFSCYGSVLDYALMLNDTSRFYCDTS